MKNPICFVDVETTGTNSINGKIIEIGIVRVEDGEVTEVFNSLVNPEMHVDPFIEKLTGINVMDLENAPTFFDIKEKLIDILYEATFVAHNVRFDYSFIRNEFKRLNINYTSKHFCTVKLARRLYPSLGHFNLDNIIQKFGIRVKNRHRALDDAMAIWEFYKISKNNFDKNIFNDHISELLKKPSLPPNLNPKDVEELPEEPGVYVMYGENNLPIYIGKSINIKDRVLSHFTNDYLSNADTKIVSQIKSVEAVVTAGELSALLLESKLIKEMLPVINRAGRFSRKMIVIMKSTDKNGYFTVNKKDIEEIEIKDIENILGVFRNQTDLKKYLSEVAKKNKLCPKILGLEKCRGACFYTQLKECNGACINKELNLKYNMRFDEGFSQRKIKNWPFSGPIKIKESGVKTETHLVDKWCYLGSVKDEGESLGDKSINYLFDYNTYKILRRFIHNSANQKYISVV